MFEQHWFFRCVYFCYYHWYFLYFYFVIAAVLNTEYQLNKINKNTLVQTLLWRCIQKMFNPFVRICFNWKWSGVVAKSAFDFGRIEYIFGNSLYWNGINDGSGILWTWNERYLKPKFLLFVSFFYFSFHLFLLAIEMVSLNASTQPLIWWFQGKLNDRHKKLRQ